MLAASGASSTRALLVAIVPTRASCLHAATVTARNRSRRWSAAQRKSHLRHASVALSGFLRMKVERLKRNLYENLKMRDVTPTAALARGQAASRGDGCECNPAGRTAHGGSQPQGRHRPQAGATPPPLAAKAATGKVATTVEVREREKVIRVF
ncbi:hypothetical protein C4D60_Mb07t11920 [Musa balbisiana]|uniref:Uncharacterized protein n=1 Tax=Musa balbisiana TaxID=52838 RepID=A0A4S8JEP5_MUSBA|nr:hypothetical protein C4D60_Mb07t11920 [Musa balbisiana]